MRARRIGHKMMPLAGLAAAGDLVLAVLAAFFGLRFLVIAGFLFSMTEGRLSAAGFFLLTSTPLAFAAASVVLLSAQGVSWTKILGTCGLFGAIGLALALRPAEVMTNPNDLGLASQGANISYEFDFSNSANKDSYPRCRYRNNSLGYRDEEPPVALKKEERRILLVGDSYIWGDGIPVNEETLAYLLRAELARLAPGRFSVMSAAYPGLGLYGYGRFIDVLSARYDPKIVVVGYLGQSDCDPFDAQYLLDHLPRRRLVRNLVLNLGAAQYLHEASGRRFSPIWTSVENREYFAALTRGFSLKALKRGYRLMFLDYLQDQSLPEGIEALDLPEDLRYPWHASDLWYAKDFHPKTKLNRILAKILAEKIVQKGT